MKPSLDSALRKIARLPLPHQIAFLRTMISLEKPGTIRWNDWQLAIQDRQNRLIKKQNAADRRRA